MVCSTHHDVIISSAKVRPHSAGLLHSLLDSRDAKQVHCMLMQVRLLMVKLKHHCLSGSQIPQIAG